MTIVEFDLIKIPQLISEKRTASSLLAAVCWLKPQDGPNSDHSAHLVAVTNCVSVHGASGKSLLISVKILEIAESLNRCSLSHESHGMIRKKITKVTDVKKITRKDKNLKRSKQRLLT